METFKASVKYGDWKGSAAADQSDATNLSKLLLERGLQSEDEFLVGAKLSVGENQNNRLAGVSISAYLFNNASGKDVSRAIAEAGEALELRRVQVEITLEEFVCLFKRFAVSLSAPSLEIEGRQFTAV